MAWGEFWCRRCGTVNIKGEPRDRQERIAYRKKAQLRRLAETYLPSFLLVCVLLWPSVGSSESDMPDRPKLFVYAENELTPGFELRLSNESGFSWKHVVFIGTSWRNDSHMLIRYTDTGETIYSNNFSYYVKYEYLFPGSSIVSFQVVIDKRVWNFSSIMIARDAFPPEDLWDEDEPVVSFRVSEYEWEIVKIHIHHIILSFLGVPVGVYIMRRHKDIMIKIKKAGGG